MWHLGCMACLLLPLCRLEVYSLALLLLICALDFYLLFLYHLVYLLAHLITTILMPGRWAKTESKKNQEASVIKDELIFLTMKMYQESQEKLPSKWKGLQTVCQEVEELHRKIIENTIKLNYKTLCSQVNGWILIWQTNKL